MPNPLTRQSVLIIANSLFYPARRNGVSVRYFPLCNYLRSIGYRIDIVFVNKYSELYSDVDIAEQRKLCDQLDIINPPKRNRSWLTRLPRRIYNLLHLLVPFGIPYTLIDNNRNYFLDELSRLLGCRVKYDACIGVGIGGNNADLLLSLDSTLRPDCIICDFVDSAYLLRKRNRPYHRAHANPLAILEDIKLKNWEKSLCKHCECIYISDEDARSVGNSNAHIIHNCVVTEGYSNARSLDLVSPNIAFLGNMSYEPNIEACKHLVTEILPVLRSRIPDIQLYIIGRNPDSSLVEICNKPYIHVTGEVDNIWDYIRSVDTFVFPMLSGAGLQNKIIEAMYAGKVVVTSPIGNEGINAVPFRDIYIARNTMEYAEFIQAASSSADDIGINARSFVKSNFSIDSLVTKYEHLLVKS